MTEVKFFKKLIGKSQKITKQNKKWIKKQKSPLKKKKKPNETSKSDLISKTHNIWNPDSGFNQES